MRTKLGWNLKSNMSDIENKNNEIAFFDLFCLMGNFTFICKWYFRRKPLYLLKHMWRFRPWYFILLFQASLFSLPNLHTSDQIRSVAQSCPTLCDPMNCSTPGLPIHHQLPEFTQTHVHRVSDAIQPSHPLLSPSPPAPNPSQHQRLFQWVNSLHEVAKVLEFQL